MQKLGTPLEETKEIAFFYLKGEECPKGSSCKFQHRDSYPIAEVRALIAKHLDSGGRCDAKRYSLCHKLGLHKDVENDCHDSDYTSVRAMTLNSPSSSNSSTTPADVASQSDDVISRLFSDGPLQKIVVDPAGFLTTNQLEETRRVIARYRGIWNEPTFNNKAKDLGVQLQLRPLEKPMFVARQKALHPEKRKVMQDMINDQIRKGIVEPSKSATTSTVLLVPKPGGKWRFCVDYTSLNKSPSLMLMLFRELMSISVPSEA